VLERRGAFTEALDQAQEMVRVGQEAADHHVVAWGLLQRGAVERWTGPLEQAVAHLEKAIALFKAIPDYAGTAQATALLAQCHLRQGRLSHALRILEEANRLVAERRLRGFSVLQLPIVGAELYLAAADDAPGAERAEILNKAKQACYAAMKMGNLFRGVMPLALRSRGTYEWLKGKPTSARKWWRRSLARAEELGTRHYLALIYLEMGKRLGQREDLVRAEAIFTELGATLDLAQARELVNRRLA